MFEKVTDERGERETSSISSVEPKKTDLRQPLQRVTMSTLSQSDSDLTLQHTLALLLKRAAKASEGKMTSSFLHVTRIETQERFE